jgi:hypothetical protein
MIDHFAREKILGLQMEARLRGNESSLMVVHRRCFGGKMHG